MYIVHVSPGGLVLLPGAWMPGYPGVQWWACISDTLIYPSIFAFHYFLYIADPPLHTLANVTWPHAMWSHTLVHNTCLHFIRLASLIWWTHVLQFTCLISILSSPNVRPPMAHPIMNPHAMQSGTYYSFASDEPCAYHLYLTCLYLPFTPEREPEHCLYKFSSEFRLSAFCLIVSPRSTSYLHPILHFWLALHSHTVPNLCFTLSHTLWYHARRPSTTPGLHPQSPIGFTLRSHAPSILATAPSLFLSSPAPPP